MIVNRAGLATAMGVSEPTIDRWVKEGCPAKQRGARGRAWEFSVPDVVAWWGARERENAAGGMTSDEAELKRRKLQAETGQAELAFAVARGEVAPIREFQRAQEKMLAAVRQNVLNVAQRAVLQLLGETDETVFKQRLRAELTLALEQSAQVDFDLDDESEDDEE